MTTATDRREYVEGARKAGAIGYLIKPLSFDKIVAVLEQLKLIQAYRKALPGHPPLS